MYSLQFLILFASFTPFSFGFLIGIGKYDITGPVTGVDFMGYANPFQIGSGLHMRLYSRAFLIGTKTSSRPILFINIDAGMSSQLVKTQVVNLLQQEYGADVFDHSNVMISATHTHSGPGGYFQYFLFDVTSLGFSNATFEAMTSGILQSVKLAFKSLTSGRIYYAHGELNGASINRSPLSYLQNPNSERQMYTSDVDQIMLVLKFVSDSGQELGMLNWFPVHGTSMNTTNRLVSSDNKGLASLLFERWKRDNGNGNFIAAFAQSNEGDVSPNTKGAKCLDTGSACDFLKSTCQDGKVQKCIAFGPGDNGDMFESTRLIAELQFEKAKELYIKANHELGRGDEDPILDFRHQFIDMTNVKVTYDSSEHQKSMTGKTCIPALGYSFGAGTSDGPGIGDLTQGMLNGTGLWRYISSMLATPSKDMIACHAPKPILIPTGLMNHPLPWHPSIVETQIFRIGPLVIAGLPGEFTTMAGRRLTRALAKILPKNFTIALAGLSNGYTHYITTYEEYQVQRYEGASTIYGPHTLQAYIQQFIKLTKAMLNNDTLLPGDKPPFLLDRVFSFNVPQVPFDMRPPFRQFGSVWKPPKDVYHKSDGIVEVSFITGLPRAHPSANYTLLTVEKLTHDNNWEIIYTDADWETKFVFKRIIGFIPPWFHVAEIQWTIDSPFRGCIPGIFRIRHFGIAKDIFQKIHEFIGETSPITIFC